MGFDLRASFFHHLNFVLYFIRILRYKYTIFSQNKLISPSETNSNNFETEHVIRIRKLHTRNFFGIAPEIPGYPAELRHFAPIRGMPPKFRILIVSQEIVKQVPIMGWILFDQRLNENEFYKMVGKALFLCQHFEHTCKDIVMWFSLTKAIKEEQFKFLSQEHKDYVDRLLSLFLGNTIKNLEQKTP